MIVIEFPCGNDFKGIIYTHLAVFVSLSVSPKGLTKIAKLVYTVFGHGFSANISIAISSKINPSLLPHGNDEF